MAVGLVDLWWATCHQFKRGFFVPEFTSLLTPNFMAATACFNMFLYPTVLSVLIIILAGYSHTPWQTVRLSLTLASSTASWYICTLLARSGYLIASSIRTKNSFWAFFAWPPWPRIVLRTFTCAPRMQEMKASIDWLIHDSPACVKPEALLGANQSAWFSAASRWNKSSFLWSLSHLHPAEFVISWIFKFSFGGSVRINVNASQTVVCPSREAKITRWVNANLVADSFVWSHVIMVIIIIIKDWMLDLLAKRSCSDASELVQNAPDREAHVEDIKSSYLREADLFRFQICHEKFHTPVSRRTQQSWVVVANISCQTPATSVLIQR